MASGCQQFPPQTQERQPGKEHAMEPVPQATSEEYKPANKASNPLSLSLSHTHTHTPRLVTIGMVFCAQGKVALVTGGDSGIGRAVCYCFALEGATVAFTYVKSQEDEDANDTLQMPRQNKRSNAKEPIASPADLGYEENCRKVVEEVMNTYGCIDILVNNAAEQYVRPLITEITEQQLQRVFRTNIFSYFFVSK
ncbi:unnamed protein product [Musa textilis]